MLLPLVAAMLTSHTVMHSLSLGVCVTCIWHTSYLVYLLHTQATNNMSIQSIWWPLRWPSNNYVIHPWQQVTCGVISA